MAKINIGAPSVSRGAGLKSSYAAGETLPDPATLPAGTEVVVDGNVVTSDGQTFKPALLRDNSSIIVFGTSIENFTISPDGTKYPANGGVRIANSLMGWPWKNIYDFGVNGSKSPDFVARLPQTVGINAGWVWVGFPINDVIFDDVSLADTLSNMRIVYDNFRLTGAKLIINLGQPISAFSTDTSGGKKQRYFAIREFVINYADTHDNCHIVDTAFSFTDVSMNGGFNLTAVTSDGIHDNYVGAFKKGTAIKNAVKYAIRQNPVRDGAAQNYYQHCTNPMGVGDNSTGSNCFSVGVGITGTGPNQWQVRAVGAGTAVGSRSTEALPSDWPVTYSPKWVVTTTGLNGGVDIAFGGEQFAAMALNLAWTASTGIGLGMRKIPTSGNGYYYTVIVSGTTSATEPVWPMVEGATVVDGGVGWLCRKLPAAGERWYAEVEYSITATTGGVTAQASLEAYDTAGTKRQEVICNHVDTTLNWALPQETVEHVILRTPEMTISSGYAMKWLVPRIKTYGAASSSHTVEIHRINFVRVE